MFFKNRSKRPSRTTGTRPEVLFFKKGTSRCAFLFFGLLFSKNRSKRPSQTTGTPLGALILTKLVEWYRFGSPRCVFCCCFFRGVFQKIGQNGRPGRWEPPRGTSFDDIDRMESKINFIFGAVFVLSCLWCQNFGAYFSKNTSEHCDITSKTRQQLLQK